MRKITRLFLRCLFEFLQYSIAVLLLLELVRTVRAYGIRNVTQVIFDPSACEHEDCIQQDWSGRVSEQKVQRQFCDTLFNNILKRIKNIYYVAKNI